MLKVLVAFIYLILPSLVLAVPPLDRYGGHYSVIIDTSPGDTHYRFYRDPGKTGVNDFESRAIQEDIFTIWKATSALSECSRLIAANILLEKRMDIYMTYPPGVYRSTGPFDESKLANCTEGTTPLQWK